LKPFARGQKGKLSDLGCGTQFPVEVEINLPGASVDVSCFGLDANEKLSDDRFMVFYNQLAAPGDAVKLDVSSGKARFAVNLDALPATITQLVFVAAIDGAQTMRSIGTSRLTLGSAVEFPLEASVFGDEKAVIVANIYRKEGIWRFGAVGQGFNGGLSALLAHFGGSEAAGGTPTPAAAPAPAAPAPPPKISLSKVTLEKRGDKVSLDKRGGAQGYGRIHVNLNWNQNATAAPAPEKTGFLARLAGAVNGRKGRNGIDLDLGCMYEMMDGRKGIVQALGNSFGDFNGMPFIQLEADDRTGAALGGENLYINGDRFDQFKRALIFTFIYEGVPNWSATDAVVTMAVPNQGPIEVRQVTKMVEYFQQEGRTSAHELMDRRFGFGMRWKTGTKD
jgi:tellurite resistance protein TerA